MNTKEFEIAIPIVRAYKGEDGYSYLEGVASSTKVDSFETIFNRNCQQGFALDIISNAGTYDAVKLEAEHKGHEEPINIIGTIADATVNENDELVIRAILDVGNPKGKYYWDSMTNPDPKLGRTKKFGLSINGVVKEWHMNTEGICVFDRVKLEKIGIVREPSNPSTWLQKLARSVDWSIDKKEISMEDNLNPVVEETQVEVTGEEVIRTDEPTETVVEETIVEEAVVEEAQEEEEVVVVDRSLPTEFREKMESAVRGLMDTFMEEVSRMMTSTAGSSGVHEDVSKEIEQIGRSAEVAVEETVAEPVTGPSVEDIVRASADVTKELLEEVKRDFGTKLDEAALRVSELATALETEKSEKAELIERLAKLEAAPAAKPGMQIQPVFRTEDESSLRRAAFEKAKAKNDVHSMFKIALNLE
jgi:hypothetical protein